jgi:hypothetical protein
LCPDNPARNDSGTILLWVIGVFVVSIFVFGALISLASYVVQTLDFQSVLEISATNASDQLNFSNFYLTGNIEDVVFEDAALLADITKDLNRAEDDFSQFKIENWRVDSHQFWLEISHPWTSPLGDFEILPKRITASVHITLDSNRHLQ